jgi:hypothetical protein
VIRPTATGRRMPINSRGHGGAWRLPMRTAVHVSKPLRWQHPLGGAGAQIIKAGDADAVCAGGEVHEPCGLSLRQARWGYRLGPRPLQDPLILFARCPVNHGRDGGNVAGSNGVSRETRTVSVDEPGGGPGPLRRKIPGSDVPVPVPQKKGEAVLFDTDGIRARPRWRSIHIEAAFREGRDGTRAAHRHERTGRRPV